MILCFNYDSKLFNEALISKKLKHSEINESSFDKCFKNHSYFVQYIYSIIKSYD